jgi:predicted membrane channel-forming protein YqfA (hemolysin III family)
MLAPLQLVDSFLLNYNVGDALVVVFALGLLATLPRRSRKLTTLHFIVFGSIFLLTPSNVMIADGPANLLGSAFQYKLLGLVLLVVSPIIYTMSNR